MGLHMLEALGDRSQAHQHRIESGEIEPGIRPLERELQLSRRRRHLPGLEGQDDLESARLLMEQMEAVGELGGQRAGLVELGYREGEHRLGGYQEE